MNTNFNKKWLLSTVVLIVWVLFANRIVESMFVQEDRRTEIVKLESIPTKNTVYGDIASFSETGDIFNQCSIAGGSFCETEEDNKDREVYLIFKGNAENYRVRAVSATRPDMYYKYSERLHIFDGDCGFQANFSTLGMRNGVYELLLEVKENDTNFGFSTTGKRYLKDNTGLHQYTSKAVKTIENCEEMPEAIFYLDNMKITSDGLKADGWAKFKDNDCDSAEVFLQVSNEQKVLYTYELTKGMRLDISSHFGSEKYRLSGIISNYKDFKLDDGEYDFKVIQKYEGKYYISTVKERVIIKDQTIESRKHIENK